MKRILLTTFLLSVFSLLFSAPPVFAEIISIYPSDPSDTRNILSHYSVQSSTCNDSTGQHTCYQLLSQNGYGNPILLNGSFRQTGGAWWIPDGEGCCTSSINNPPDGGTWFTPMDTTKNCGGCSAAGPKWAQQSLTIPANVNKITRINFVSSDPAPNLKLELLNSSGSVVTSTIQSSWDFQNLNWPVNSGAVYSFKISRVDNEELVMPIISSCGGNCEYGVRWGTNDAVKQANKTHNATDAYAGGSGSADGDWDDRLNPYDLASVAVFGEVPTSSGPVIESSEGKQQNPSSFTGGYGISGKEVTQGGAGWFNPVTFVVKARPSVSSGPPIKNYFLGLYDKATPIITNANDFASESTSLELQRRISSTPTTGFLLRYDTNGTANNLLDDKHFVWEPCSGRWTDITGLATYYPVKNCSGTTLYEARPVVPETPDSASWTVVFKDQFQSKIMYTGVYVKDTANQSAYESNMCVKAQASDCPNTGRFIQAL